MSLSQYDPLASLRAVENAFSRFLTEPQPNRPWAPSVDIYETENELAVKADLPDVDPVDRGVHVERGGTSRQRCGEDGQRKAGK